MTREFYRNFAIGMILLIISIMILYHGFLYGSIRVLPMVVDYLVGSIVFILSISSLKKAIRSKS